MSANRTGETKLLELTQIIPHCLFVALALDLDLDALLLTKQILSVCTVAR